MDIRTLRYFIIAAESQNLSRAAEHLNLVQSALSHRIKALERELGAVLFERHGRSVRLSRIGRLFLEEAKRILDYVELAKHRVDRAIEGEIGTIRIGFQTTACRTNQVSSSLLTFRERYPLIELKLTSNTANEMLASIRNGDLDGGFLHLPAEVSDLNTVSFGRVDWMIAMPRNHRFTKYKSLELRQLRDERFIWVPRDIGSTPFDKLLELCRLGGLEPNIVQEASDEVMTFSLVASGMGLSFVFTSLQNIWPEQIVAFKRVKNLSLPMSLCFAWNPKNSLPSLMHLISVCSETKRQFGMKSSL